MLVSVDIQAPDWLRRGTDTRATFRKSQENALRPVYQRGADRMRSDARYQSIAGYYRVTQETTDTSFAVGIVNDHHASRYLIRGTRPHAIPHAFGRPGSVQHPGTQPDTAVVALAEETQSAAQDASVAAQARWAARWGQE